MENGFRVTFIIHNGPRSRSARQGIVLNQASAEAAGRDLVAAHARDLGRVVTLVRVEELTPAELARL